MSPIVSSSTTATGYDEGVSETGSALADRRSMWPVPFIAFDASAVVLALATGLVVPTPSGVDNFATTAAVFSDLSWDAVRTTRPRKSVGDEDVVFESPNWLAAKIHDLKSRGYQRRKLL